MHHLGETITRIHPLDRLAMANRSVLFTRHHNLLSLHSKIVKWYNISNNPLTHSITHPSASSDNPAHPMNTPTAYKLAILFACDADLAARGESYPEATGHPMHSRFAYSAQPNHAIPLLVSLAKKYRNNFLIPQLTKNQQVKNIIS